MIHNSLKGSLALVDQNSWSWPTSQEMTVSVHVHVLVCVCVCVCVCVWVSSKSNKMFFKCRVAITYTCSYPHNHNSINEMLPRLGQMRERWSDKIRGRWWECWYMHTCTFIYAHIKVALSQHQFSYNSQTLYSIMFSSLTPISPKSDNKCKECWCKFVYIHKSNVTFTVPVFMKLTVTQDVFVDIAFSKDYANHITM